MLAALASFAVMVSVVNLTGYVVVEHHGHEQQDVFPIIGAHVLGWNVSFVAATAQLADRAAPAERGKLLGFNDQLSALTGAALALLGGYALDAIGVVALAVGATVLVLLPLVRLLRREPEIAAVEAEPI